ncbi:MBL fold metallo-hydrolase [Flavobacterium sediminis]|uniref:MBL fold metallo-hydrolase n=1 Tax=Flavobacterium sediminis TaxID=2201181 RepID=A0A2U8QR21_9FLAO|nr:MBL fold metallo-hydrolase [Flavobacterium sediminis]AWM12543.1 MBL fold metallo-hydrolase [Flavobacterium sediminis]
MKDLFRQLGESPKTKQKEQFNTFSNYANGKFQNITTTPALREGESMLKVLWEFFKKHPETEPKFPIPSVRTDLKAISKNDEVLVWFGHSSYFFQTHGKTFLVDPVFSGNASPIPGSVKAFKGADDYNAEDMPDIDFLLISHDHWDHLDYHTIQKLQTKVSTVICGMGVKQHFEYWGWDRNMIHEKNWYESVNLENGFSITLTPARHFSGRLFTRNISLWTSFVLETPSQKLFLGGDSGYGPHFDEIGAQFGPFDLAILECGQYNEKWPYIHSLPEEIITETKALKAQFVLPVHHSKFKLAQHPWYEPLQRITELAEKENYPVITPKIGEKVILDQLSTVWEKWWEQLL